MSINEIPAIAYSILAGVAVFVQLALAMGKAWGKLTLAGHWPEALPPRMRFLPILQALLLALMTTAILDRSGVTDLNWPSWTYWTAMGVTAMSLLANAVSPSPSERRLWAPVLAIMLLCGSMA